MTTLVSAVPTPVHAADRSNLTQIIDAALTVNTPSLLISPITVAANFRRLELAFPQAHIYYAIKANPHPSVVGTLVAHGCGIDVASGYEVSMAASHGADPAQICFSAPFKRAREIADAYAYGIRLFVADSPGEIQNIARHAPNAKVLIRVAVRGGNALTPMGRKFGANPEHVLPLALLASSLGLTPCGLHFHVGSQCLDALAWSRAIAECAPVWHALVSAGFKLRLLDIGGGFPVTYDSAVPTIEEIAKPTLAAVRVWLGPDVQVALEPGRWMTCDAAVLVTEVIGKAMRGDDEWIYLDAGVYNGLIDTVEGVVYPMHTPDELLAGESRPRQRVTLAGPSCDGNDVLVRNITAPVLEIGDRLLLSQAGAYTTAFERFNGLSFPQVVELIA